MNPDAEKWIELAHYDIGTAEAMLASSRYLYVLFCSQQAMEKTLKAAVIEETGSFPPRTHDLMKLARAAKLSLSDDQDIFLRTLTKFYIGTRYPEEVGVLVREATSIAATELLSKTKQFITWLETPRK